MINHLDPKYEELAYPPGYCLDPNGRMCAPADSAPHYDFGYEVGFREAMSIKMRAIEKYVAAERARCMRICEEHAADKNPPFKDYEDT